MNESGKMAMALARVVADLGLPPGDRFTQDWIYELPPEYRTSAWVEKYLEAYRRQSYGLEERQLLFALVLDALDDLVESDPDAARVFWSDVVRLARESPVDHADELEYWAARDEDLENAFALSPLVRALLDEGSMPPKGA